MNFFWILVVVIGMLGAIFLQGFRRIPASPPYKGQATWLGKRISNKVYDEGWGFFLLYPYLVGFVLVKVERISLEIISEKTRTPDRAESKIPVFLTIRPISKPPCSDCPSLLIEYIDSGQEEGVRKQLTGKILERIREWAVGPEEGPVDWIELNQSHLEAVSVLVKQIAGNSLTVIPEYAQPVPTWIWLRYFAQPQPTKFLKNEDPWAKNDWQKVRAVLDVIEHDRGFEAIQDLKVAVEGRRKDIEALRTGAGKVVLRDLGVMLERMNLGDIDVLGGVGEQAEGEAREEQERQKEEKELEFVRKRMKELMRPPFNFTNAQARDIVQTERGKVVRTIDDKQISLDATTAQIVATVLGGRKP